MRKTTVLFLVLVALVLAYSLNAGMTGFSTATEETVIDKQVLENLEEDGKAQVIVVLKEPKKLPKTTGFITAIIQTKTEQNVLSTLSEDEFEKKHEYSIIKGFSGEVTAEGLEKLKRNPNVEKIYFDKIYTLSLTDSIPLINASKVHTYSVNEQNLTGAGETICILDTGIDYAHESFGSCSQADFLSGNCQKVPGGYDYVNNDNDTYDDHGHGTHVAGIAAANGNVIGVAPDAQIVMIKVCDSGGSCSSSSILSGFDWCVTNKDLYNISVISMSLGDGGQYTSATCPSDPIDAGIASAYSAGIFLVAASGNNHYTSGISHPACNENVTAAGGTTKTDTITFNRGGDLLTLLAPGVSITSTWIGGSTTTLSGTSMSTPHLAGAAAILKQYAKANSTQLSQAEIRTVLNNTGKAIYDSSSDKTYARIDLFEAVRSLTQSPTLIIYSPTNSTYDTNISMPLEYEAADVDGMDTVWYNIDDGENIILSGNTTFNTTSGSKTLNIYANDTWGNENSATVSFTIDLIPRVEIVSPQNTTYPASTDLEFDFSVADQDLDSCWYKLDEGDNVIIESCANITLNMSEGSHNLKLFVNDSENNEVMAETSFTTDLTSPLVYLELPADNSFSSSNIQFKFRVADLNLDNCKLYGDWNGWHANQTKTGLASDTLTSFDELILTNGNHTWNVECSDLAGHTAFNDTNYTLAVDSTNPTLTISSPTNTTYLENASLALDFSISDDNLDSCSYNLNDAGNTTITDCENTTLSITTEQNTLKIYAKDLAGNEVTAEVSFTTDLSYPLISLSSPAESSSVESPVSFNYTVNDYGIANCSLLVNGTVNQTDDSITTDTLQDFSTALTPDRYYWSVKCVDYSSRENVSEERNFVICNEAWNCTDWTSCSDSQQTRTCTDSNSCGTTHSKPTTSQTCSSSSTGGTSGGEAASGPAGSTEILSEEDDEETPETPTASEQPETKPEEQKPEQPAEMQKNETVEEEKGFISKALSFFKGLKDRIVNPKQTFTSISTRAVDGAKNHKIAATSFIFIISMMVFTHFYFFKRYRMKKLSEDLPIPLPPKIEDVKSSARKKTEKTIPIPPEIIRKFGNPAEIEPKKTLFSRIEPFKTYKELLGPKKPSE